MNSRGVALVSPRYFDCIKPKNQEELMLMIALSLFFCGDAVQKACEAIFDFMGIPGYKVVAALIVYFPLIYVIISRLRQGQGSLPVIFPATLLGIIFLLLITLSIHPEYAAKVFQEDWAYNFLTSVLYPLTGLYAAVFILVTRDFRVLLKGLWAAALLCFIYGLVRYGAAQYRGYWYAYAYTGVEIQSSYSLGFGYDMLLCCLIFMLFAFRKQMIACNICLACVTFFMILTAGNRMPLVIIVIAFAVFFAQASKEDKDRRGIRIAVFCLAMFFAAIIALFYTQILTFVADCFDSLGLSSRSIDALISGNFTDDNGRDEMQSLARSLIQDGPFFGYGLYGDRYYLGQQYYWGYPHNIVLEFQLTFGQIPGLFLFALLIVYVASAYSKARTADMKWVLLLFVLMSIELWVSISYLYAPAFWAMLSVAYMIRCDAKQLRNHKKYTHRVVPAKNLFQKSGSQ